MGFTLAVLAAVFWGSYIVPFKKSGSHNLKQFQLLITVGVFLVALLLSLVGSYTVNFNAYAMLAGALWALGNMLSLLVINELGLAKGVPIWVSVIVLVSFAWGVLFFNELVSDVRFGMFAIALLVLGVIITAGAGGGKARTKLEDLTLKAAEEHPHEPKPIYVRTLLSKISIRAMLSSLRGITVQSLKQWPQKCFDKFLAFLKSLKAVLLALAAGVCFGSMFVPITADHISSKDALFPMSFGILITGIILAFVTKVRLEKKAVQASIYSGVIWGLGNICAIKAIDMIGIARGMPISQLGVLVAMGWGMFYFKEIPLLRHRIQVFVGAAFLLVGVMLLGMT
jgi:glucose uptake protein GlcU